MAFDLRKCTCPSCGKKTLKFGIDKDWSAWKDREIAICRSCGIKFKIKMKESNEVAKGESK